MAFKVTKTEEQWRQRLTPEQFAICREKGTERAFTGEYHDCKTAGIYRCVGCGADLFDSETKFDSGTGWPSFGHPLLRRTLRLNKIIVCLCAALRCIAVSADVIWATFLRTGQYLPDFVTALTRPLLGWNLKSKIKT